MMLRNTHVMIIGLLLVSLGVVACSPAAPDLPPTGEIAAPQQSAEDPASPPPADAEETEPEPPAEEAASPEDDSAAAQGELMVDSGDIAILSDGQSYASYLAAPSEGGPYSAVVLIHSFNGMEEGYRTMTDRFAGRGFVVLAVGWQTFERSPADSVVQQLVRDSIAYLSGREDVDPARIGLTGFCAGGRYTMLLLPQIEELASGVAWYGFPYNGSPAPADFIDQLDAPMLVIHGTNDSPSPIADIYRYTDALEAAGKTFELEVYDGEPHGFMLSNGQLREDEVGVDAFARMIEFFTRTLG